MVMMGIDYVNARPILGGIADYMDHYPGWLTLLHYQPQAQAIDSGGYDGMIVDPREWPVQDALRRTKIPAVTVGPPWLEGGPPAVLVDNEAVGRMAADHLCDLGLKYLAFVPTPGQHSEDRHTGFSRRCAERRVKVVACPAEMADKEATIIQWLATLPKPVGIFAANDRKALTVAQACHVAGRRIPEDVALMGVDNELETCRLSHPQLTSIDQGPRRLGYEAARLLEQWMSTGKRPPAKTLIQPMGVVKRPSTDLLAIDDPDVVAAVRLIREHATRPLQVEDVVRYVGLSRRSLELHFKKTLGRTIHAEIMRVRIDRAKQLLITSERDMPYIAEMCGFSYASRFSRDFKRETGMSPTQFRRQFRYRSK